jgi:transposase
VHRSKKAVAHLMRINWRTVGWICQRVMADEGARRDPLAGLKRIGIDEISTAKGQRYMVVVVDHDTGRLVWAHPGRDRKTAAKFLDRLGKARCAEIKLVSCDDADWITKPVGERCKNALVCLDPFHIVKAATDALDEIRREIWNEARKAGQIELARELKGARFVLCKNARNRPRASSSSSRASSRSTNASIAPTCSPSSCA